MSTLPTRSQLILRARRLRKQSTQAETRLWSRLRRKQLAGKRFRRQHVLHPYIVDFYCFSNRLVIEIDGSSHDSPEAQRSDQARTEYLKEHHRVDRVLRFSHAAVLNDVEDVLSSIWEVVSTSPT